MINDIASELFSIWKAFEGGGNIYLMNGVDKNKPDFKAIITLSILFAKEGHQVRILTSCHFKSPEYKTIFGSLFGTKYERKCQGRFRSFYSSGSHCQVECRSYD